MTDAEQFTELAWIQFLGIEPLETASGSAAIQLRPGPAHLNHNGTLNAAVLFGLAEVAGAGALVAGMLEAAAASYVVVRKATIEYEAPARGEVTARGVIPAPLFEDAIDQVRRGCAVEAEVPVVIADSAGSRVCSAQFTIAVRPRRQHQMAPDAPASGES